MIKKIGSINTNSKSIIIWVSILILVIIMFSELTFGMIYKNTNKKVELFREEIRNNTEKIEVVESIAIRSERNNAVMINRLENIDKDLIEIKLLLKELHDR